MNRVVGILMKRDGITQAEAEDYIEQVRESLDYALANGDYEGAEDALNELGLEPDYLVDILI